jgi:putative (di)nucleoside polyphosphate hydrolase
MIDTDGFRIGVGIIVCNEQGEVVWTRRIRQSIWQFPQGGIEENEPPEVALYRELFEELGLQATDVQILGETRNWLSYRYPPHMYRAPNKSLPIGQKQKWFLLSLTNTNATIRFDTTDYPEFDKWRWVNYWYPIKHAISFKRHVYRRALEELMSAFPKEHLLLKSMQEKPVIHEI